LKNIALNTPVFPSIENERSMIYIDNLCEFVKILIENQSHGLYFPQNEQYVCTSEMVKMIAEFHGKKVWMTKLFNLLLRLLNIRILNKVFGNLVYDRSMSEYSSGYCVCDFNSSIPLTERGRYYELS
jgi:UDP-glucose 4-epimerase